MKTERYFSISEGLLSLRYSFNNNTSERSCKAFVTGRKNWLFADTPKGADASALVSI